jgi:hypothetical protein
MRKSRSALSRASTTSSSCFGVSGPIEEKVEHQADARQRRLQLMTDRRHEVALYFVEQAKPRDVFQEHCCADRRTTRIADGQDARQERVRFLSHRQRDGLVESFRQVLAVVLQGIHQRLPQGIGRLPNRRWPILHFRRHDPEDAARHGIGQLHALLGIDHQNGIGKGVDRGLAGLLRAATGDNHEAGGPWN